MNGLAPRECQRENSPDSGGLDDWTGGLCKVHTRALSEAPKYPACFVALQSPVSIELVHENPLSGDDVGSQGGEVQGLRCGSLARHHVFPP